MASTSNAGSKFLANANPRLLTASNASIILTASAPLFHLNSVGVPDITSIVFTAQLIALDGIVSYSCLGGTLTSVAGNSATLLYSNMTASVATVTVSLVYRGVTFTQTTKINKVQDGSTTTGTNGINTAIAYAYQRAATAPTAPPGDIVYDFAQAGISFPATLANGWLRTIPSGSDPLYVTTASASSTAATDSIANTEWSSPVVLAQNGTQGLSVATIYIYQRTTTNSAPTLPGSSSTYTFNPPGLTGLTNGWTSVVPAASAGGYLWVSTATATNTTPTDTILSSEWAAAQLLSQDGTGTGSPGAPGNSVATVTLYQWSTVVPANPTGTATFTWASGATTAYSGSDGWYISAPANPGSPGIKLFLASVPITAPAGTAASTATFGSAQIVALSQNGASGTQGIPGIKTATVSAYQWSLSAPTTTGTATYNWFNGTYDTPPSTGWTAVKGNAPGSGYTLYEASVRLVESTGASTSAIDWTTASISGIAYQGASGGAGAQGASSKRAYVLVNGNSLLLSPTSTTRPGAALPITGTWGETNDWQATPPTPGVNQSVFQTDGIFDPVPNQTVWNVPYLSNLKVGSLSAISAIMGALTAGSIDLGSGALSWHVDTSGNMWSGASTYAAAKFRVSTGGDVVMKSFLLQDDSGNTILSASGTLGSVHLASNGAVHSGNWTVFNNAPAAGARGFYLGPEGMVIGDYNGGSYFVVYQNGRVEAPGFNIINGSATFSGALQAASGTLGSLQLLSGDGLRGGAFVNKPAGQEWPNAGSGPGFQLGNGALRLGNFNDGKYMFIGYDGNIIGPQFSIINGAASFSGNLSAASGSFSGTLTASKVVTTDNIADGAISGYDYFLNVDSAAGGSSVFVVNYPSQVLIDADVAPYTGSGTWGYDIKRFVGFWQLYATVQGTRYPTNLPAGTFRVETRDPSNAPVTNMLIQKFAK